MKNSPVHIDNSLIDSISRILGELLTGTEITKMFHILELPDFDIIENRGYTSTKWRRIAESVTYHCKEQNSPNALFDVIEYKMRPKDFISIPDVWKTTKQEINSQLIFYGLELSDAGKIQSVVKVETFNEARKRLISFQDRLEPYHIHHEVSKYCEEELLVENYFHAILEASKGLLQRIRDISELDKDGSQLIDEAFIIKRPIILIRDNMLSTQTEQSEYKGLKSLLHTITYLYRNPQAHETRLYNPKSENDAVTAFSLISLAHQVLDNCVNVRDLSS
ncbi:TIGR02391 family protein [Listeria aquatica]|uniref:TIGR02391 family protein n=1 Tax=Listeria aquatica TaxID=1494960 RepID=UPI003EF1EDB7